MSDKAYVFKPLAGLSRWTFGLITAFMVALGLFVLSDIYAVLAGGETARMIMGLTALAYLALFFIAGITTLVWIYNAARNARALRPSMTLTPGWAVGWYFVPFANLYKPYTVILDIWGASRGPAGGDPRPGRQRIAIWWWLNVIGNILSSVGSRIAGEDIQSAGEVMSIAGMAMVLVSTGMFLTVIREIHRFQMNADVRVAEQF